MTTTPTKKRRGAPTKNDKKRSQSICMRLSQWERLDAAAAKHSLARGDLLIRMMDLLGL